MWAALRDMSFRFSAHPLSVAMARENIKDIISVGFSPDKTFIFCDVDYLGVMCVWSEMSLCCCCSHSPANSSLPTPSPFFSLPLSLPLPGDG